MNSKNLLFTLLLLFCYVASHAQTFTLITNDQSGDQVYSNVKDLKAFSYHINTLGDSIWFKIETYNAMQLNNDDFGFTLGIDDDLVTTNGTAWGGPNQSMKCDHNVFVLYDGWDDTDVIAYAGVSDDSLQIPCTFQRPDEYTLIVGFPMSEIDDDGNFNVLLGSGGFDFQQPFDDAPNTGYGKVRRNPAAIPQVENAKSFTVYPNPVATEINWNRSSQTAQLPDEGYITDLMGRILQRFRSNTGHADVHTLAAGNYIIHIGTNATIFNKK